MISITELIATLNLLSLDELARKGLAQVVIYQKKKKLGIWSK